MRLDGATLTRVEVEDFLYREAALLDAWRLDEWLGLLTDDAIYRVPSNDQPGGEPSDTLFLIADDMQRIRGRVTRLQDRNAHAEYPHSRIRHFLSNVRIVERAPREVRVEANFVVYRFRRDERIREYVGQYRYRLRIEEDGLKIAERHALLDPLELGTLGSVSFIL